MTDARAMQSVSVLVVDDDDDVRQAITMSLEAEGYSVAGASDGAAAMTKLRYMRPDLILLDLTMPGVDGAAFRELQFRDEELAAIPTVVITARSDPGRAAASLLARACLTKPVELDELLALVNHYCDAD